MSSDGQLGVTESATTRAGRLTVYFGAAPGVGKTYAMLDEAHRRQDRGTDVVVGLVETHGRAGTAAQLEGLEEVPRRVMTYQGRDGYLAGETLHVHRDGETIDHLTIATFVLTRTPYGRT